MAEDRDLAQGAAGQDGAGKKGSPNEGFSSANPPRAPSGLSTPLQPSGTLPAGGPGASAGSLGTGGGQTKGQDTGSPKRDGV